MPGPDWRLLETFVRVAEAGSLTGAAQSLGLSQPTASRYMQALEQEVGARLFVRHSRGLGLTDRGAELFHAAKAMDEAVQGVFRRAAGLREAPKGTVRVSVNEPLGVYVLPPCFAALRKEYPEIAVEVVIDNAVTNLSRREADVAVRMFRPEQLDLVAKKVGAVDIGLFASDDYVKRRGAPPRLSDAADHDLVGGDRDVAFLKTVKALGLAPEAFTFRTDSLVLQVEAIVSGVGIGGLQIGIARRFPELHWIFPELAFEPLEMWIVTHQDLHESPVVRAVFAALSAFLSEYSRSSSRRAPAPDQTKKSGKSSPPGTHE